MNTLLSIKRFLFLSLLVGSLAACSDDDDAGNIIDTDESIADFVENNEDFSMLDEALEITNLDETLDDSGAYTVFAPTNAAFTAYLGDTNLADVDTAVLRQLLLNHVIDASGTLAADFNTGYINTMATFSDTEENVSMYVNTEASTISINGGSEVDGGANVTNADNELNNGVVHAVDAVIQLPTVTTFAAADPNFSTLTTALTRESDFTFIETLSTPVGTDPAPFTVFAPTNDAFTALLEELEVENLDDIDTETLEAALNLHVIANANVREADLATGPVSTLGGEINVTVDDNDDATLTDANGRTINFVSTNVQAANGVIHVIDQVLLPEIDLSQTIADFVAENEDYSLLLAALQQTGLDETLNDEDGNFTVFAPNNAAFEAFLQGNDLESIETDVLAQLLLNHVLNTRVLSGDIATGYVNTMATFSNTDANISSYLSTQDGVMINGEATVTSADNELSNGVIHAVDAVIPMPTVTTFATVDPNFETLETALTRDGSFDFVPTLDTPLGEAPAPFTVFAPTNDAFAALLNELEFGELNEIPAETLEASLNLHVIVENNIRAEDLPNGDVETLGGTISVNADNFILTDPTDRTSSIVQTSTNVQASNGVIHAIDVVLLPAPGEED